MERKRRRIEDARRAAGYRARGAVASGLGRSCRGGSSVGGMCVHGVHTRALRGQVCVRPWLCANGSWTVPRPRRARGAARTRVVDGAGLVGRSGLSVGSLGSFRAAAEMWPPETWRDVRSRPEGWLLRGILFLAFCLILFSLLFPSRLRGEDAAAAPPREPMRLPAAPAAPAFQTPRPRAAVAPLWFPAGSPNAAASSRPLVGWLFLPRGLVGMGGSLSTLRDLWRGNPGHSGEIWGGHIAV